MKRLALIEKEKDRLVNSLNKDGIAISHVDLLFEEKEKVMFSEVKKMFNEMLADDKIQTRMRLLRNNNPICDKDKIFEITAPEYLGRGLGLSDNDVIKLSLNPHFLDVVEAYLGSEVKVRNVLPWIHSEYPRRRSHSMKWHRDTESEKHVKIFIYFNEVSLKNGAPSYVKHSAKGGKNDYIWHNLVNEKLNGTGYLNSSATAKIPQEDIVHATGSMGTIVFVNSNGFHKGGYVREGHRAMTHFLYVRPTACQIVNGTLTDFNYDPRINYCNYESEEFQKLSERQKRCLRPGKKIRNGG